MNQVSEILGDKGSDVLEIEAGASVLEAVKRMVEANIGSLLVRDAGEVAGIVTERDYLRSVALEGTDEQLTVREIMSSPLVVVSPETTIDECMALMTDRRIRHVPVVGAEGEVVGIVSIGDVVKFKSKQQSFEIRYLTDYITAG
jgi:CBS domain-containing protein